MNYRTKRGDVRAEMMRAHESMYGSVRERLKSWPERLARADMAFFILPALIALLVAGTLAQRWIGLHEADKMFFSALVIWLGPLPLPGGITLLALLSASLTLKFLLKSEWSLKKSGVILTHLGALVLLIGGLLTAWLAEESFMIIPESGESAYIYDYHEKDLLVFENDILARRIPFHRLRSGQIVRTEGLPFALAVRDRCENCAIIKRENPPSAEGAAPQGMARFMALQVKPGEKEAETNLAGLSFAVTGAGEDQDGLYIAFDGMPKPVEIRAAGRDYKIMFGKRQRALPFSLSLQDFVRDTYPGTEKARTYHADVTVHDGPVSWPARIAMNRPLRYKGYTFYQSSFEETPGTDITILAVVRNRGRLFPYAGTALIALGLLLHLFITLRSRTAP